MSVQTRSIDTAPAEAGERAPIVSDLDHRRLGACIGDDTGSLPALRLRELLERARVVPPEEVPADVVTMNSRVVLRERSGEEPEVCTLAYPEEAGEGGDGALSVLSPLGSALLAAREGQRLTYMGARSQRSVLLERIEYQPERSGRLDH